MSNPINRVPAGLVSLLDLAGRAQAPRSMEDNVRLVVSGDAHYYASVAVSTQGTSSPISGSGYWSANVVVPQGQRWKVLGLSFAGTANVAAATTFSVMPALSLPGGAAERIALGARQEFLTGTLPFVQAAAPGFIVPPGANFGLFQVISGGIGTAQAFTATVLYVPLSV